MIPWWTRDADAAINNKLQIFIEISLCFCVSQKMKRKNAFFATKKMHKTEYLLEGFLLEQREEVFENCVKC